MILLITNCSFGIKQQSLTQMHFDTEIFRTSDKEILKEVERQIKENRKNELLRNTQQLTEISEENNSKKNRRKAMKEMVMCLERIQLS